MPVDSKKVEIKKLMKEMREKKDQKIISPFAKYNSLGELSCTLCNAPMKSSNLWAYHIGSKSHKENVHKLKEKKRAPQPAVNAPFKRTIEQPQLVKKQKSEKLNQGSLQKSAPTQKSPVSLAGYSSSDDEMDVDELSKASSTAYFHSNSILPPDFFDSTPVSATVSSKIPCSTQILKENNLQSPSIADALPEGFFDDPVLDAKARNIEYKDPAEEEWERFQKTIAEESNISKTIMQEDLEESTLERNIDHIDEQIYQWERSKIIQCRFDDVKVKSFRKDVKKHGSGSSEEDVEEEDLLDWRAKSIKRF